MGRISTPFPPVPKGTEERRKFMSAYVEINRRPSTPEHCEPVAIGLFAFLLGWVLGGS